MASIFPLRLASSISCTSEIIRSPQGPSRNVDFENQCGATLVLRTTSGNQKQPHRKSTTPPKPHTGSFRARQNATLTNESPCRAHGATLSRCTSACRRWWHCIRVVEECYLGSPSRGLLRRLRPVKLLRPLGRDLLSPLLFCRCLTGPTGSTIG